jgi:hypothetical protein
MVAYAITFTIAESRQKGLGLGDHYPVSYSSLLSLVAYLAKYGGDAVAHDSIHAVRPKWDELRFARHPAR